MELIDGHDILYLSEHGRKFDESSIKRYSLELCDAVKYLYEHKIIHGDIKPSNVLINAADKITYIDFNISLIQHNSKRFSYSEEGTNPAITVSK